MTQRRPDLHWRDVVRSGMVGYRSTEDDPEADFLAFVEAGYAHEKGRAGHGSIALLMLAVALLTYGRLDVIDDIFASRPPRRHPAEILLRSVSALLPLPPEIDPRVDPELASAWIAANRSSLRWSATEGRFESASVG